MVQPYGYASPPQQQAQGYYTSPPPQPYRASAGQARVPVQVPAFNPYQPQAQRPSQHAAPAQVAQPPLQQKGTLRPGQAINVGKEQVVVQRYLSEGPLGSSCGAWHSLKYRWICACLSHELDLPYRA